MRLDHFRAAADGLWPGLSGQCASAPRFVKCDAERGERSAGAAACPPRDAAAAAAAAMDGHKKEEIISLVKQQLMFRSKYGGGWGRGGWGRYVAGRGDRRHTAARISP